jgi:hypothetical protein
VDRTTQGPVEGGACLGREDGRHFCRRRGRDEIKGQHGYHGNEVEDHEEFSA